MVSCSGYVAEGTAAVESAAPTQEKSVERQVQEEKRLFVVKDDSQTACAISGEPFNETWDEDLQEWVYLDAVRIPDSLLSDVGLPSGSIVKVALLDPKACELIRQMTKEDRKRKMHHTNGVGGKKLRV